MVIEKLKEPYPGQIEILCSTSRKLNEIIETLNKLQEEVCKLQEESEGTCDCLNRLTLLERKIRKISDGE